MDRLTKTNWLDHGLNALAQSGFTALKADKLAKSLGVSRGSFYWHFANLADFHAAVLARWAELTTAQAIEQIDAQGETPVERLRIVIEFATQDSTDLERAVRAWAMSNSTVRQAVAQVDASRLAYLQMNFEAFGLPAARAYARAHVAYFGYLGQMVTGTVVSAEQRKIIAAEIIELVTQNNMGHN